MSISENIRGLARDGLTTDHTGSTFDSFLDDEGIREEVEAVAIKRVRAWQRAIELRSAGQPRACPELVEGAAVPTRFKTKPPPS